MTSLCMFWFALTLDGDWGAGVELECGVELPVYCCGAQDLSGAVFLLFSKIGCLDILICGHMRLHLNNRQIIPVLNVSFKTSAALYRQERAMCFHFMAERFWYLGITSYFGINFPFI